MKKLLSILLVLSLVYGLCGCAGGETTGQTESNESAVLSGETVSDTVDTAEGDNKEISYDFTVSVTMPAAFTVYLDNEMHISAMEAGDADAEAILSGLELAGMTYDEGMGLVLNAAYEQGILAAQGKVYFAVTCDAISMSFMDALFAPVMQFEKDNEIFVYIDWNVIPEEEPNFEANYLYGLQKIEGEDQTIYMEKAEWIHPISGGQTVYSYFSEFPDPSVYDLGSLMIGSNLDHIRIKMLYFNEDGSWAVSYFKDGQCVRSVDCGDASFTCYEYENGVLIVDILKNEDGSYSFTKFAGLNEQEGYFIPAKSISCWEDGTQAVYTYHSNGKVATSETIGSYGCSSQATYDENGNEVHSHVINRYADGTYSEYESENGQLVYNKGVNHDGTSYENQYENDQPIYNKTINPDGTYVEGHCENGIWTFTEGTIEPTEPES